MNPEPEAPSDDFEDGLLRRSAGKLQFGPDMAAALFIQSPDAIVVVDWDGLIRLTNPQAELLFGYHRTEMAGQPVEMLLPPEVAERHRQHRADFADDPRVRPMGIGLNLMAQRKNGTKVGVDINLAPIVTASGPLTVATVRRQRRPG